MLYTDTGSGGCGSNTALICTWDAALRDAAENSIAQFLTTPQLIWSADAAAASRFVDAERDVA